MLIALYYYFIWCFCVDTLSIDRVKLHIEGLEGHCDSEQWLLLQRA